ncbi:MAG TPA: hypothetical protein VE961_01155, partial [Pyrinomonadaceae bacterium]|nr:hypothetical protein [Pyrinomonadaceae bacterium]
MEMSKMSSALAELKEESISFLALAPPSVSAKADDKKTPLPLAKASGKLASGKLASGKLASG